MRGVKLNLKEQELAKIGLAQGKSLRSVARSLKKSPATIKKVAVDPKSQVDILRIRESLAGKYEKLADRFVNGIPDKDIAKMNPYSRILSSGIAIDKGNLLRGLSPTNSGVVVNIVVNDPRSIKEIDVTPGKPKDD